ncbi:MAG: ABC transporter ATP-binding protein [Opitutae bacterium]|jgi:ABC-type lipoprotein export system ATPase subunit|nr:ABC transporter ATP-binding protein [Opitutae bacterium]
MSFLEVRCLKKSFPSPEGGKTLVVDVDKFSLQFGTQSGMKGESGSGKTTFLHLVAGILKPDQGEILLDGREVSKLSESARDRLRAESIGYVFQSFNLLQGFTCLENVLLASSFAGQVKKPWAKELLDRVGLSQRMHYYPRQLSIGQQQRVAVARALANRPKLVLADEPTGNLDPKNGQKALSLLKELCRENGSALLLVSHEVKVIDAFEHQLRWEDVNQVPSSTIEE